MEERELAVSLNVVLPQTFKDELKQIQRKLATSVTELRNYDSSPHLAVCTKFMVKSEIPEYLNKLKTAFVSIPKFEIEFSNFEPSSNGRYIFLNLTSNSKSKFFEMNAFVKQSTKGIGNETPMGLPEKYPYDPHISIIKLNESELQKALEVTNSELKLKKFTIEQLEVTAENRSDDGYGNFPVVLTINLK